MEKHKCKLCSKTFNNGRALGGHMKSHLVASQSTRKKLTEFQTGSASSSSSSEKSPAYYGLRENPKKSFRVADPEFSFSNPESASFSAVIVVQDDEETETESENPVAKRVKRVRKNSGLETQRPKSTKTKKKDGQNSTESSEPVSSVSNASPEQDLAMCLIMLSRGVWKSKDEAKEVEQLKKTTMAVLEEAEKLNQEIQRGKCRKVFGSHQTVNGHSRRCSGLVGKSSSAVVATTIATVDEVKETTFKCPFCNKNFMSGQALGGHKRSHLVGVPSNTNNSCVDEAKQCLIDLNLPPPPDDQEVSSVISQV